MFVAVGAIGGARRSGVSFASCSYYQSIFSDYICYQHPFPVASLLSTHWALIIDKVIKNKLKRAISQIMISGSFEQSTTVARWRRSTDDAVILYPPMAFRTLCFPSTIHILIKFLEQHIHTDVVILIIKKKTSKNV